MVAAWIRLLGGMLCVRIRSAQPERFLNLCKTEHITLRSLRRTDIDVLYAELSVRDFWRLFRIKKRRHACIHIIRRKGLPFALRRLRGRYALLAGCLLVCLVYYELSARIWIIQTDFSPDIDAYAVMQELQAQGIGIGSKRREIDAAQVKSHMMTTLDELKFFAVNLSGNVMEVQAAAIRKPPEIDQKQGIHDVVACKDGVIDKMAVRRGTVKCKIGDAVLLGDVLVDALVEPIGELGTAQLVDARADIWAHTRYTCTRKMPLETAKKQGTGKVKTKYAIVFGKTRINLYFGSSLTQGNCDRILSIKQLAFHEHFVFPVSLYCETIQPYTTEPAEQDLHRLREQMEYGVRRRIENGIENGSFSSMHTDLDTENGAAVLRAEVWCYEQIGVSVEDGRTAADLPKQEQQKDS